MIVKGIEKCVQSKRGTTYYWLYECQNPKAQYICFLHGLTADHRLFDMQIDFFAHDYNIIVWDAPAHGRSRPYLDFSYSTLSDELNSILTLEGVEKVILVGQSMGGYVSQMFISKYPLMVSSFIGIDTCPFGKKYYSKSDNWWLKQVGWMSRLYPHKFLLKSLAKQSTHTEYGYRNFYDALTIYSKSELCKLMDTGYKSFLIENHDITIPCPVLILVGRYDKVGKVRQYCQSWHESECYPMFVIDNAGHNANADNFRQVNCLIEDFLNEKLAF